MKRVKIPGSKYIIALEEDENQYFLRLRIGEMDRIEEEIPVTHLEKKALRSNIKEILNNAHLPINDIQLDNIHRDIVSVLNQILGVQETQNKQWGLTKDPRISDVINRIDQLSERVGDLKERIIEAEKNLSR